MYKLYFKQALAMLKENKLLSLISILGTALAICMIMVMVITYEVRVNNYSPRTTATARCMCGGAGVTLKVQTMATVTSP